METTGLLFIPDISGFTRFVTETEIDHGQRLIQELLEVVIDANQIGLEVSEIEGDAVLFYRFGDCPDLARLSAQVERMFRAFHERLKAYEISRFCQCRACVSASNLTLKVITHYGQFTKYSVRQFNKLFGRDVIVAHQLLKNDIDQHEYWLATAALDVEQAGSGLPGWIEWNRGVKTTESGDIDYHYTWLSRLRQDLAPAQLPDPGLSRMARVVSASREYDAHLITLLHAAGEFRYRSRWQEGVLRVEEMSHYLPRVGTRCRRIMDDGQSIVYTTSYSFRPERVEFTESEENGETVTAFTLEALEPLRTRLTIATYLRRGPVRELLFGLTRRKRMEASLLRSLENLDSVVKEIDVPVDY